MVVTNNRRVSHRPLGGSTDAVVQTALVGIVSAVCVGQEEGIDAATLEEFG